MPPDITPRPPTGASRPAALLVVALLAAVAACTAGGPGGSGGPTRASNFISPEEFQQAAVMGDAWQAIERLRPAWLRQRAGVGSAAVFLNGQRYGDLGSLRGLPAADLESARFISAADATTLYGTGYPAGIIDLRSRRRE